MSKEEDYLLYLKRNIHVDDKPDIDSYAILIIFQNYIKRLQHKIEEIREHCKQSSLEEALLMQSDLMVYCK